MKFSGQYELNIAIHYSLLGVHLFRFFSQILYQGQVLDDEYVLLSPPIYLSASDSAGPRRTVGASVLLAR